MKRFLLNLCRIIFCIPIACIPALVIAGMLTGTGGWEDAYEIVVQFWWIFLLALCVSLLLTFFMSRINVKAPAKKHAGKKQ